MSGPHLPHRIGVVTLALMHVFVSGAVFAGKAQGYEEGTAGRSGVFPMPERPGTSLLAPEGTLTVIVRFSGVADDGEQGSANRREATSIHCTNFGASLADVEVQVYQWNGTDVWAGMLSMPAGQTSTFSTQDTAIYFEDVFLGGGSGTDPIFQGSGLILSDSGEVRCTVQVLDPLGYPPAFVTGLEMYR